MELFPPPSQPSLSPRVMISTARTKARRKYWTAVIRGIPLVHTKPNKRGARRHSWLKHPVSALTNIDTRTHTYLGCRVHPEARALVKLGSSLPWLPSSKGHTSHTVPLLELSEPSGLLFRLTVRVQHDTHPQGTWERQGASTQSNMEGCLAVSEKIDDIGLTKQLPNRPGRFIWYKQTESFITSDRQTDK